MVVEEVEDVEVGFDFDLAGCVVVVLVDEQGALSVPRAWAPSSPHPARCRAGSRAMRNGLVGGRSQRRRADSGCRTQRRGWPLRPAPRQRPRVFVTGDEPPGSGGSPILGGRPATVIHGSQLPPCQGPPGKRNVLLNIRKRPSPSQLASRRFRYFGAEGKPSVGETSAAAHPCDLLERRGGMRSALIDQSGHAVLSTRTASRWAPAQRKWVRAGGSCRARLRLG